MVGSACGPDAWGLGDFWLEEGSRAGPQDREGPQSATNPEGATPQTQHLIILEVRSPTASHWTQIQGWVGPFAPGGPGKTLLLFQLLGPLVFLRLSSVPEAHMCGPPSPVPATCVSDLGFRDLSSSNSGPPASLFHADNPGSFLVSRQCFPQLQSCPCCGRSHIPIPGIKTWTF